MTAPVPPDRRPDGRPQDEPGQRGPHRAGLAQTWRYGTASVDFDGVIHTYEDGWRDGSVYGGLVPGAVRAIGELLRHHALVIHTTRDPHQVLPWLAERTEFSYVVDGGAVDSYPFWTESGTILISRRKWAALFYIDDRAVRFTGWPQTLARLSEFSSGGRGHPLASGLPGGRLPGRPDVPEGLRRLVCDQARIAARAEWQRREDEQVAATPAEHADAVADAVMAAVGVWPGVTAPASDTGRA